MKWMIFIPVCVCTMICDCEDNAIKQHIHLHALIQTFCKVGRYTLHTFHCRRNKSCVQQYTIYTAIKINIFSTRNRENYLLYGELPLCDQKYVNTVPLPPFVTVKHVISVKNMSTYWPYSV